MSLPGLVADYGSGSDSSSDEDDNTEGAPVVKLTNNEESKRRQNLLEVADDSSDENSTEVVVTSDNSETIINKLPNPLLHNPLAVKEKDIIGPNPVDLAKFSVFTNQYREAQKAKDSILEKHVKMTESIAGAKGSKRQICFKFRKGKCHFGKSCKYSHDLDTVTLQDASQVGDSSVQLRNFGNVNSSMAAVAYNNQQNWQIDQYQEEKDEDSYMANVKRKRRAGINDTLLPSKRALVPLEQQRAKERPWTMNKKH